MKAIPVETFVVKRGRAEPLAKELETKDGKYMPPVGGEVLELPPSPTWWAGRRPRKIVVYPENSVRPYPLASLAVLQPDAMKPADFLNLYGPYMPGVFRRAAQALIAEFEKIRLKDWIIIIMVGLTLVAASIAAYYAYKLWSVVT